MDYQPTESHSNYDSMLTQELTDPMCKGSSGSLIIYARYAPSRERNFSQVVIPVAISYETFLVKLCVALGVCKEDVIRVIHLPDILIKSTEDVIRLQPFDKLEVTLETGVLPKFVRKSIYQLLSGGLLLQCCLAALLIAAVGLVQVHNSEKLMTLVDSRLRCPAGVTGAPKELPQRLLEVEKTVKQLSVSLHKSIESLDADLKNLYSRSRLTNEKLTGLGDSLKTLSQLISDEDIEQTALATSTEEILRELKALRLLVTSGAKKLKA